MKLDDCVVRIAGEGGEGVISCGQLLTLAIARAGYHVHTWKTFPSEIRGGLARYQFRLKSEPVHSIGSSVDVLMAFNQEAVDDCCRDMSCKARLVVYDPDTTKDIGCDAIPGNRYGIALNKICKDATGGLRAKNVVAMGVVARILNLDMPVCRQMIVDEWSRKGQEVVDMNQRALEAGYARAGEEIKPADLIELPAPAKAGRRLLVMSGNDAVALGALAAGCRVAGGYPITPATSVFEYLCKVMPRFGGKAIQTEDEIAALATCIGASFAGKKAMTVTSGPGIALMCELINLASMLETPVVIVDVQRGGPSTGLPTKTEQSDLSFATEGTPGEAPRIVLAAGDVEDCFHQTIRAFNLAEKYQLPVILMTDASLAFRLQTIGEPDLGAVRLVERERPGAEAIAAGYRRYKDTATGVSPMAIPGTPGAAHIASSLEHLETGAPDYSPAIHQKMTAKRFRKLDEVAKAEADSGVADVREGARVGLISWGSTEGAIREARARLEQEGIRTSYLHPRLLWPLADQVFRPFLAGHERIVVIEENFTGQLARILRARYLIEPIPVTKCAGAPFTPGEVYSAVKEAASRA